MAHETLSTALQTLGVHAYTHGEAMVIPDFVSPDRWRLWALADYFVSSVQGGSIWLLPRRK